MELTEAQAELLDELAWDNPPPEERWFSRDSFDPMHKMGDLRSAARKGLIELQSDGEKMCRFRLTPEGRAALRARSAMTEEGS